jgi:hypothetical protein
MKKTLRPDISGNMKEIPLTLPEFSRLKGLEEENGMLLKPIKRV